MNELPRTETFPSIRNAYDEAISAGKLIRDLTQEKALDELDKLYKSFVSEQEQKQKKKTFLQKLFRKTSGENFSAEGVYLYGPAGRGKSYVMDLFYETVPVDKKKRVHFREFMADVHDALHVYRQQGISSEKAVPILAEQLVKENRLICFDEMTVSDIADSLIIGKLFQEMFDVGLIVVATSNVAPDDLYKDGIQRERFLPFIELIKKKMTVIHLTGKIDYRMERLRTHQVYYTPVNAETRAELDTVFAELTEHDTVEKKTMTVKGHMLHIPRASSNVARFTFQQLCGQPKGASDYLALARHFECIILEGVPVFENDQSDLVKRFVLMVDAFFEKKVKLIISADGKPEELYKKGPLKNEMSRAAARLSEMQSLEYIESAHRNV